MAELGVDPWRYPICTKSAQLFLSHVAVPLLPGCTRPVNTHFHAIYAFSSSFVQRM